MSSRVLTRLVVSVLAGALCGVVVACALLVVRSGDGGSSVASREAGEPAAVQRDPKAGGGGDRPREVLRAWDAARARAWTSGDARALATLYTPGSVAGRRDVAMLRAWIEREARVTSLATQVLRLRVLVERPGRLELVVTDRVARVQAAGLDLPRDRPTTRRLVLVRLDPGGWRVASVSPERPAPS